MVASECKEVRTMEIVEREDADGRSTEGIKEQRVSPIRRFVKGFE